MDIPKIFTKTYLKKIAPPSFQYSGFWDGRVHFYREGGGRDGGAAFECSEDQILDGTFDFLVKKGYWG